MGGTGSLTSRSFIVIFFVIQLLGNAVFTVFSVSCLSSLFCLESKINNVSLALVVSLHEACHGVLKLLMVHSHIW